jgi:hypothetical protein
MDVHMEKTHEKISLDRSSLGEAAVDGLFAGMMAGVVMAFTLLAAGWIDGQEGMDAYFFIPVGATSEPTLGVFSHMAVSGVYGVAFGLVNYLLLVKWLKHTSPGSSALLGLIYGVVLWSIAALVLLPGSASPMQDLPAAILMTAHLVYGLVLGIMVARRRKL